MTKIIFFQAHPDDLEFNCGQIIHYLVKESKNNNDIIIASMTKGEFGLPGAEYDKFKGEFLAGVRTKELYSALAIHGISPENVKFFGYIDGFVPFSKKLVGNIAEFLKEEKPDIIFAPEPIYTYYYHRDHINTGRAVFHILHNKMLKIAPILYFYTSISSNFYFGFKKSGFKLMNQLLAQHKTQNWFFNRMKLPYRPLSRYAGLHLTGWKYAEPYRRVYFNQKNQFKNKPNIISYIFSHFFHSLPFYEAKYPEELLKKVNMMKKSRK